MNKNVGVTIVVIVFLIVSGGIYASLNSTNEAMIVKEQMEQETITNQKMTEEKAMMEKETMEEKNVIMKAGSYEAYAPEKVILASATHDVVLFFRASWCPTCRTVDTDIKANLSKIPSNLSILDVDYDNSTLLKQKYGITYQHTFVQIDQDGNIIKKWSGSPTLTSLVAEVK